MGVRLRLNAPKVIHEEFDDEVVIANLDSGRYYSVDLIGAAIWRLVIAGITREEIFARIRTEFTGDAIEIERGTGNFLDELVDESLLIAESIEDGVGSSSAASPRPSAQIPFVAPRLQKYTDMEELLLLDPVHEVDETGWPRKREP